VMCAKARRWLALTKKRSAFRAEFHRTHVAHLIPNESATRLVDICATRWLKQKTGWRALESGAGTHS